LNAKIILTERFHKVEDGDNIEEVNWISWFQNFASRSSSVTLSQILINDLHDEKINILKIHRQLYEERKIINSLKWIEKQNQV
jgi:hypothetical protein